MEALIIEGSMPGVLLESHLPENQTLVVVRRIEARGIRLYIVKAARLLTQVRKTRTTGLVEDLLLGIAWSASTPTLAMFDPRQALKPGESLAGILYDSTLLIPPAPAQPQAYIPACAPAQPQACSPPPAQAQPQAYIPPPAPAQPAPNQADRFPEQTMVGSASGSASTGRLTTLFEAYPGISAPETASVGTPIQVEVWLAGAPVAGVRGPDGESKVVVDLPAGEVCLDLDLQLVARGFRAESPGWRQTLRVNRHQPEATRARFTLVPGPQAEQVRQASIQVHFAYQGNPCGYFWREVLVLAPEVSAAPGEVAASWREAAAAMTAEAPAMMVPEEPASSMRVPVGEEAADLTVRISKADRDHGSGLLTWTFESPLKLGMPTEPCETDLGSHPEGFAKGIVDLVQQSPQGRSVVHLLKGVAKNMADKIPDAFWTLMDEVRAQVTGRAPSVLILTEEAFVPWELAWVEPLWDPARPAFLGAQVSVSRWILSGSRSGPPQPPRSTVEVRSVTVLAGDYASYSGFRPLPHALEEAAFLERELKAAALKATEADLELVLGGEHMTNVLHFACHGEADPRQPEFNRIVLAENLYLSPDSIRGYELSKSRPFVFLNACQVGQGGEVLGEYAGFASAFLKEGCPGFLGPLWAVDDVVARDVARQFYTEVLKPPSAGGRTVGEVLRDLRSRFLELDAHGGLPAVTYLAYVYYGHPNLRLIYQKGA